jgi:imidazole glycerol-phosphate synthase subunit HisH
VIGIVDLGICNTGSVRNMLLRCGYMASISSDPQELMQFDKLILPGVGNFGRAMQRMEELHLIKPILNYAKSNKPMLGICLGMQLLGRRSEEADVDGLGLVPVEYKLFEKSRMKSNLKLKIPHMGWANVRQANAKDKMVTTDLPVDSRFYFVHSYHAVPDKDAESGVTLWCQHGYEFAAAFRYGNIAGVQFHPEKSHRFGQKILQNFAQFQS